tara:strand:- start:6457 stop:7590 length:1134 start_codon:yes stop_codon:yes gene_type:complete
MTKETWMKKLLDENARGSERVEPDHWWDKQHSLVLRQTPRWAQSFVLGLVLLSGGAIVASSIIKIDEVISVEGILKPTAGTISVKSPTGGLIKEVFASDGDTVSKNEILIKFDTRQANRDLQRLEAQLQESKITYESQIRSVNERVDTIQRKYETNMTILERMEDLLNIGAIDKNSILNQRDFTLELEEQKLQLLENLLQAKSQYKQRVEELKSRIYSNEIKIQYDTVKSPANGVVFNSNASERGVLSAGEEIMKVVPQDQLIADVWVTNKDIGYIKKGQKANVRVQAFDYTEFGDIKGVIKSIGADVLPPDTENRFYRYPVKINLESNYLSNNGLQVPVISGMAIDANIKLREKRLISIVSDIFSDNRDALNQLRQ